MSFIFTAEIPPSGTVTGFGLSRDVLHDAGLRANGRKDDSVWLGRSKNAGGWDLRGKAGGKEINGWLLFLLYPKSFLYVFGKITIKPPFAHDFP